MLQHTTNETTVQVGQCVATLISYVHNSETDTIAYTFELVYPRIIHSEFMTHRMFSRNAMSSRATPLMTMIKSLDEEHYKPKEFLKNQSGMVGGEPLNEVDQKYAKGYWESAYYRVREIAESLNNLGVHKQYVNRLLEPFAFIKVIVTATEWDNFFKLRLAPDAQPEIQDLAKAIKESMGLKDKLEPPEKDVDGLNWRTKHLYGVYPATARGIFECFFKDTCIDVGVMGRSKLVGEPLVELLLHSKNSVAVVHSQSYAPEFLMNACDAIVTATGTTTFLAIDRERFYDWDNNNKLIVDVGIRVGEDGKLRGDVDKELYDLEDVSITPVPGGVGLLTTAYLYYNLMCLKNKQYNLDK